MENELPPLGSPERRKALRRARYLRDKASGHAAASKKAWREANIEKAKATDKAYYEANKKEKLRKAAERYMNNISEKREAAREYYKRNRAYYIEAANNRKRDVANAKPAWLSEEQLSDIQEIYNEAARLTAETGVAHEVDHVFPLKGRASCGLHVPWNLRAIPATENRKKSNKLPEN